MSAVRQLDILLIEDDSQDATIFNRHAAACKSFALSVVRASDWDDADHKLDEKDWDVVFLDLRLADGPSPKRMLNSIRTRYAHLPVIVLTIMDDVRSAVEVIKAGANDYLLKDTFNTEVLERSLRYALHERELIVQRQQARQALLESEDRFRTLFRNIPESVLVHDLRGYILHINDIGAQRLGWTPDELVGKRLEDILAPEYVRLVEDRVGHTLRDVSNSFSTAYVSRSGRRIDAEVNECLIKFEGQPAILSVARDVTERVRTTEALRNSAQKFRAILESVRDVTYKVDLGRGNFSFVSPSVEKLLGFTPAELVAMGARELYRRIHPEDRDEFGRMLRTSLQDPKRGELEPAVEYRIQRKDGDYVWLSDNRTVTRDAEGRPAALVGTVRDITGRKRAELALRQYVRMEERPSGLPPLLLSYKDEELRYVWLNGPALDALGRPQEQIIGKTDHELFQREAADRFRAEDELALQSREPCLFNAFGKAPDGQDVWREVIKAPIRDSNGELMGLLTIVRDVSAQVQAEAALSQWASVASASRDAIVGLGRDGAVLTWNPAAEQIYGYAADEITGRPFSGIFPAEEQDGLRRSIERVVSGEEVSHYETTCMTRDGSRKYVALTMAPIVEATGQVNGISTVARDITARREAEDGLRQAGRSVRNFLDLRDEEVFVKDAELRFLFANRAFARAAGMKPEDIPGKTDYDLYRSEKAEKYREYDRKVIEEGEPIVQVLRGVSGKGTLRQSKLPLKDAQGNVVALLITNAFPDQERRVEEAFCHWASLVASSDDAVIGLSLDGSILSWNPGAERMYGYSEVEVSGQPVEILAAPEHGKAFSGAVRRAAGGISVKNQEVIHSRKDGHELSVSFTMSPIVAADGEVAAISMIARDITARKNAEEEQRRLEESMRQAQKLESLGVLAGGIAHDFNNLLTGVLGNSGLALLDLEAEHPARPSVERAEEAARHAAELANEMLAYSGRAQFALEEVDLSELIENLVDFLGTAISKTIALKLDLEEEPPLMKADPVQLKQIVLNLVTNASEAIGDEKGTISIRTKSKSPDTEYFEDACLRGDSSAKLYVSLEVTDTGCGMREEVIRHMFDPFFTTKFTGRGLGLAAALGIVRAHNGTIKVSSEEGKGTSFEVLFPAALGRRTRMLAEVIPSVEEFDCAGMVLIVDDEETVRSVVSHMVARMGFDAHSVEGGEQAIEFMRENGDEVVAVLLDMTMPGMSSKGTFEKLREMRSDLPIILSSGYTEDEVDRQFSGLKPAAFVQKPYSSDKLKRTLVGVLQGK